MFWSKGDSSHLKNFPSFQISWICRDVFQINEKFIHNCPPCLLAEMAKVSSSVARPRKCYINRAVYIVSYKEPFDQSDCWKLLVQLWNYTNLGYYPVLAGKIRSRDAFRPIARKRKYLMDYNFLYKPTRLKKNCVNNRNGITLKWPKMVDSKIIKKKLWVRKHGMQTASRSHLGF